ncbi:serine/threonine-protein kinase [Gracilimonas sp.]|uniref:serine/threonine-protein kinase n=1 Tax=Gracilimonas sp. TaxID=1974203 RepID=UPI0032F04006
MDNYNWQTVETIIDEVLELPIDKREAYLLKRCKGNEDLHNEVKLLLASITESEGWLEHPEKYKEGLFDQASQDLSSLSTDHSVIGTKIGSYIITEKIGEGGMGSVFRAERADEDFTHEVALKIIQKHRATDENIQRFKKEQQILANLKHPGIAQLYDGGVTDEGFPFIIMEYIDGEPITEYCQQQNCSIEQKIELFKKVLDAVQYAHENLTIHRDLKPDNILIDQQGNVKILDFGISKLLDDDDFSITKTGTQILTLRYASPEQIINGNITTASDFYSLGVILYKLLTGQEPFDLDDLTRYQVEQIIVEKEPELPSSVAGKDTREKLKGDLDAIIMKSIRKEPESRYRTASDFLNDLNNYNEGLPVSARDDSFRYRSGKFMRRHRQGITIAAGILIGISALIGFYTWRITQERNQAQLEAQKAEEVAGFLTDLFSQSNPYFEESESGLDQTLGSILRYGSDKIDDELINQPEIQAEMKSVIGDVYNSLGEFAKAETLLTDALELQKQISSGPDFAQAEAMRNLAFLYQEQGRFSEAESLLIESIGYFEQTEEGLENQPAISALNHLGNLMWFNKGDYDTADSMLTKALNLRYTIHGQENHAHVAKNLNDLATLFHAQGLYNQARPYYRQSVEMYQEVLGDHPNTAIIMSNYSALLRESGQLEEAEKQQLASLAMHRNLTDENSIDVALGIGSLGHIKLEQEQYKKADSLLNIAFQKLTKLYGDQHPYVSRTRLNLGRIDLRTGNYDQAVEILNQVNEEYKQIYPPSHPRTSDPLFALGLAYLETGQLKKAEEMLKKAHEIRLSGYPSDSWRVAQTKSAYGFSLSQQDKFEQSDSLLVDGYRELGSSIGLDYPFTETVKEWLEIHYTSWEKPERLELIEKTVTENNL